ncbi:MAG: EAL domain-containing protein [Pseudomonadota bacterium]
MNAAMPRALSVLLVEDSPADGRLLMEAFKPAITAGELVVQTVKRLSLAVEALKGFDFSCVLLDLGLPDGRGVDNVRALREVDRKTAIIVLTGNADEKLAAEALALGAQDYLVKGESDGEQLLKQLRRAVQRNRQIFDIEVRRDQAFFEASHDALTLLPNAALFADRARMLMAVARAKAQPFGITLLKFDGIEEARALYGSGVADELLLKCLQHLLDGLDSTDTLARIQPDEFALLRAPGSLTAKQAPWLDQCAHRIDSLRQIGDCTVQPALRSCLVEVDEGSGISDLLALAREQLQVHSPATAQTTSISAEPTALAGRWQPWVDVITQHCVGLQLLSEAPMQSGTLVLAAAEQMAQQWQRWTSAGFTPEVLALSVSASALADPGFAAQLAQRLAQHGLPSERVQLEVDESAFRDLSRHHPALMQLRAGGFRLLLAGDGSIETSLRDFSAFPLDGYKLSAGVVRRLMDEGLQGSARRLVSAVCGAAQALGAQVIACGADTEDCAAALHLIGLRHLQGSALMPAMDADAVPVVWQQQIILRG